MSESFGLRTVGQISMNAKDLARATAFYRDVLRIPLLFEVPKMAFFDLDGTRLMVATPETPTYDHPGSILYYTVADIHEAYDVLAGRGVSFENEPHLIADMGTYELWMCFFLDTEGNHLALMAEKPKRQDASAP